MTNSVLRPSSAKDSVHLGQEEKLTSLSGMVPTGACQYQTEVLSVLSALPDT